MLFFMCNENYDILLKKSMLVQDSNSKLKIFLDAKDYHTTMLWLFRNQTGGSNVSFRFFSDRSVVEWIERLLLKP